MRIGIVGSLRDPECARLRRVDLLVTAEASPPARSHGSPCVGIPADGVLGLVLGGVVKIVGAADGEAAGREAGRSAAGVVLVIVSRGQSQAERLALALAKIRASGRTAEVVEIGPETCMELRVENRVVTGIPADGLRGFLEALVPEAPSAVTQRWGSHPEAPAAAPNPGFVFSGPKTEPEPEPEAQAEPEAEESPTEPSEAKADEGQPEDDPRPRKASPKRRRGAPKDDPE